MSERRHRAAFEHAHAAVTLGPSREEILRKVDSIGTIALSLLARLAGCVFVKSLGHESEVSPRLRIIEPDEDICPLT